MEHDNVTILIKSCNQTYGFEHAEKYHQQVLAQKNCTRQKKIFFKSKTKKFIKVWPNFRSIASLLPVYPQSRKKLKKAKIFKSSNYLFRRTCNVRSLRSFFQLYARIVHGRFSANQLSISKNEDLEKSNLQIKMQEMKSKMKYPNTNSRHKNSLWVEQNAECEKQRSEKFSVIHFESWKLLNISSWGIQKCSHNLSLISGRQFLQWFPKFISLSWNQELSSQTELTKSLSPLTLNFLQ